MIGPEKHKSSLDDRDLYLWNAFKDGDQKAYAAIFNTYVGTLYSYGKKLNKNTQLVEDVIQDVFTDLWKYRHNLGAVRSIKAYLICSFRRKLVRVLKKDNLLITNDYYLKEDNFQFDFSAQDLLIRKQEKQTESAKIKKALNKLTKRQKEIIYLRFFLDLSYSEVAEIMDLNQKSTYNLVSKALNMLKSELSIYIFLFLEFLVI